MKTIRGRFRAAVLMGAAASVLAFAAGAKAQNRKLRNTAIRGRTQRRAARPCWRWLATSPASQARRSRVVRRRVKAAPPPRAPYTSTSLWQSQEATANQIETMKPDAVALLGDLQYQVGQYSDFEQSFDLTYGAFKFLQRPAPGNHEFYDEHGETGVAGYGYFSYFNGFQIDTTGAPLTATIPDPCPSGLLWTDPNPPTPASAPCKPVRLSGRYHSQPPTHSAGGWTGGALRGAAERSRSRSRRWLVLLQSGLVAPYFAQYRVLDAAGRLFEHGHLVCRRTRMAEKGSRGESFRVHTRLLASAHVQRYQRHHPRGRDRSGLLATALRVRSRPGAERTRPPLCPLPAP